MRSPHIGTHTPLLPAILQLWHVIARKQIMCVLRWSNAVLKHLVTRDCAGDLFLRFAHRTHGPPAPWLHFCDRRGRHSPAPGPAGMTARCGPLRCRASIPILSQQTGSSLSSSSSIRAQQMVSSYPFFRVCRHRLGIPLRASATPFSVQQVSIPLGHIVVFVREHAPARHRRRQSAVLGREQADRERQSTAERTVSGGAPRDRRQSRSGCLREGPRPLVQCRGLSMGAHAADHAAEGSVTRQFKNAGRCPMLRCMTQSAGLTKPLGQYEHGRIRRLGLHRQRRQPHNKAAEVAASPSLDRLECA